MEPTTDLILNYDTNGGDHISITQKMHPLHGPWTEQHPNPEPTPPEHTIRLNRQHATVVHSYLTAWLATR